MTSITIDIKGDNKKSKEFLAYLQELVNKYKVAEIRKEPNSDTQDAIEEAKNLLADPKSELYSFLE